MLDKAEAAILQTQNHMLPISTVSKVLQPAYADNCQVKVHDCTRLQDKFELCALGMSHRISKAYRHVGGLQAYSKHQQYSPSTHQDIGCEPQRLAHQCWQS